MPRQPWRGSMKGFGSHLDPEKEEQMKWVKIEVETRVRRILKLVKSMNQGSREGNMRRKSELIHLIDDFHKQYQSLYSLYDNIKGEVRKKVQDRDEDASSSAHTSDSESYFSPQGVNGKGNSPTMRELKGSEGFKEKLEMSDLEYTILKDKLTSTSEIRDHIDIDSLSSSSKVSELGDIKDLGVAGEHGEGSMEKLTEECAWLKEKLAEREDDLLSISKKYHLQEAERLARINELESQVSSLKIELETLSTQKKEFEEQFNSKSRLAEQLEDNDSKLQARIQELEVNCKEHEEKASSLLQEFQEKDKGLMSRIEGLVKEVNDLQLEVDSLRAENHELENQLSNKTTRESAENEDLIRRTDILQQELESVRSEKSKLETLSNEKSDEISGYNVQMEKFQKEIDRMSKTMNESTEIKDFTERIQLLQQELDYVNNEKTNLELLLSKKSDEISHHQLEMENLENKMTGMTQSEQAATQEKERLKLEKRDLEKELNSLSAQKNDLEEQLRLVNREANESKAQKDEFSRKNSKLERLLREKEDELNILKNKFEDQESELYQSKKGKMELHEKNLELEKLSAERQDEFLALQKRFEIYKNDASTQIKYLKSQVEDFKQKLDTLELENSGLQTRLESEKQESSQNLRRMERKNSELTNIIAEQKTKLAEFEDLIHKLKEENRKFQAKLEECKANFQIAEKKIEEMAEEFRKTFEDNLRILSRRIRVAEQLHLENKEWHRKTKEMYEKENSDLKERASKSEVGLKNVKEISLKANDILGTLDTVALKFEECTAHFLNRISKVSCELKFSKDWIRRKNKAVGHIQDDLNCLLAQLDDKEAEILVFREKVWKSENKARELEKMIGDKEDAMLVLQEEKREAIRQLCVWIDYHRSRSDYYKKILFDITAGNRKTA